MGRVWRDGQYTEDYGEGMEVRAIHRRLWGGYGGTGNTLKTMGGGGYRGTGNTLEDCEKSM